MQRTYTHEQILLSTIHGMIHIQIARVAGIKPPRVSAKKSTEPSVIPSRRKRKLGKERDKRV